MNKKLKIAGKIGLAIITPTAILVVVVLYLWIKKKYFKKEDKLEENKESDNNLKSKI